MQANLHLQRSSVGNYRRLSGVFSILTLLCCSQGILAQDRWFQIEVSVFSNESVVDRAQESWQADRLKLAYPDALRRLTLLSDLLMIDALRPNDRFAETPELTLTEPSIEPESSARENEQSLREAMIRITGPRPAKNSGEFRFLDFNRDQFLQLKPADSDFQQTNRALARSADHRLLFHGLWRQVMTGVDQATPVFVRGGLAYGEHFELEGSLNLHFNANQDRVVVDADLWLSEFSVVENLAEDWVLPTLPDTINGLERDNADTSAEFVYHPVKIYHMRQSRDMRSTEFHYLDHPALGVVILVVPYEVPALPQPDNEFQQDF
ncbi:MAG: CsiV family protein [Proteobacteria bacterium]|nr:CsiV family protein [Pseudomonadota bacterium]